MNAISQLWGEALRAHRKKLKLSQAQVASLAGKAQSQIARLESGLEDPRLSSIVQVSRSLGTELMAIPVLLIPAVQHLIAQHHGRSNSSESTRLVGNDPEDAEE